MVGMVPVEVDGAGEPAEPSVWLGPALGLGVVGAVDGAPGEVAGDGATAHAATSRTTSIPRAGRRWASPCRIARMLALRAIRGPDGTITRCRRGARFGHRAGVRALEVAPMTTVLVVSHDIDLADGEADSLRRHGYEVRECLGPIGAHCPILSGHECSLVEGVDVLVYDAFATGEPEGAQRLIEGLRDHHPDVPLVLVATGMEPDWIELAGAHRVTPLVGQPTGVRLSAAIEEALALQRSRNLLPVV